MWFTTWYTGLASGDLLHSNILSKLPHTVCFLAQAHDISNLKQLRVLELRADEALHEAFGAELGHLPPSLRSVSLTASQPPQLARPLPMVVASLPASAPGLHLRLQAPFVLLHGGLRGGMTRQASGTPDAAAADGGDSPAHTPGWDSGYALCLVGRKLAITGLPRLRNAAPQLQQDQQQLQQQQQHHHNHQHPPESPEAVACDLANWVASSRFETVELNTSVLFPTLQPIPLFGQRGIIYTFPVGARGFNRHEHGEEGGAALVDAMASPYGGGAVLSCSLLAPEHVLLKRGDPDAEDDSKTCQCAASMQ